MPSCAIITCRKQSKACNRKTENISFHRFPGENKLRLKWLSTTGRKNWVPSKSSTICSLHFPEELFVVTKTTSGRNYRYLVPGAVPSREIVRLYSDMDTDPDNSQVQPTPSSSQVVDPLAIGSPMIENPASTGDSGPSSSVKQEKKQDLKLSNKLKAQTNQISFLKKKVKQLQSAVRRQRKKEITCMKDLLDELKQNDLIDAECYSLLMNLDVDINDIIKQNLKAISPTTKYSSTLRSFALTLHFYAPKAYMYVKSTFETCLPHSLIIEKWYQSTDAKPGFTKECLHPLMVKFKAAAQKGLICNLVMEEVAIEPKLEWDGHESNGFVSFGKIHNEGDHIEAATEALVFLLTAINGAFKTPVGYFLLKKSSAEQKATLVRRCLEFLYPTGITIVSLTFNGSPTNVSMAEELGGVFKYPDIKPHFEHPITKKKVFFFLGTDYTVKLVRTALKIYGEFVNAENQQIKWSYLNHLNQKQEKEDLHLGTSLGRNDIFLQNQQIKVRLASELFSNSAADALTLCSLLNLTEFHDTDATVDFLRTVNDLADILNSRNMKQHEFKKPLHSDNKEKIYEVLNKAENCFKSLKLPDGSLVIKSQRKGGFIGFIVCIRSLKEMYEILVEQEKKITHLPAHKISQDHLELLLGNICSPNGENLTARQFKANYEKLLIKTRYIHFTNCKELENKSLLNCPSAVEKINSSTEKLILLEEHNTNLKNVSERYLLEEEINVLVGQMTEFSIQEVTYLARLVVTSLQKKVKCDPCAFALLADLNSNDSFNKLNVKSDLVFPSNDVITVCKKIEKIIKEKFPNKYQITCPTKLKESFTSEALNDFIGIDIFKSIENHQYDQSPMSNHLVQLIKAVMEEYIDLRLNKVLKPPVLSTKYVLKKYLSL